MTCQGESQGEGRECLLSGLFYPSPSDTPRSILVNGGVRNNYEEEERKNQNDIKVNERGRRRKRVVEEKSNKEKGNNNKRMKYDRKMSYE